MNYLSVDSRNVSLISFDIINFSLSLYLSLSLSFSPFNDFQADVPHSGMNSGASARKRNKPNRKPVR